MPHLPSLSRAMPSWWPQGVDGRARHLGAPKAPALAISLLPTSSLLPNKHAYAFAPPHPQHRRLPPANRAQKNARCLGRNKRDAQLTH